MLQSDLARVEYWGSVGQWIEREDADTQAHLARVAYTLRGAAPAVPGTMLPGSLLQSALAWLADAFVAKPRPPSASAVATVKAAAGRDTGVVALPRRRGAGGDAADAPVPEAAARAAQAARSAVREQAGAAGRGDAVAEQRWPEEAAASHRGERGAAATWHARTLHRGGGAAGVPRGWRGSGALVAGAARVACARAPAAAPSATVLEHARREWPERTRGRRQRRWRGHVRRAAPAAGRVCLTTLRRLRPARAAPQHGAAAPASCTYGAGRAQRLRRAACAAAEQAAAQQAPSAALVGHRRGGACAPRRRSVQGPDGALSGGALVHMAAQIEAPADWCCMSERT